MRPEAAAAALAFDDDVDDVAHRQRRRGFVVVGVGIDVDPIRRDDAGDRRSRPRSAARPRRCRRNRPLAMSIERTGRHATGNGARAARRRRRAHRHAARRRRRHDRALRGVVRAGVARSEGHGGIVAHVQTGRRRARRQTQIDVTGLGQHRHRYRGVVVVEVGVLIEVAGVTLPSKAMSPATVGVTSTTTLTEAPNAMGSSVQLTLPAITQVPVSGRGRAGGHTGRNDMSTIPPVESSGPRVGHREGQRGAPVDDDSRRIGRGREAEVDRRAGDDLQGGRLRRRQIGLTGRREGERGVVGHAQRDIAGAWGSIGHVRLRADFVDDCRRARRSRDRDPIRTP